VAKIFQKNNFLKIWPVFQKNENTVIEYSLLNFIFRTFEKFRHENAAQEYLLYFSFCFFKWQGSILIFFIHHLLWNPNFVWSGLAREYFFVKTIVAFIPGGVIEVTHMGYSQFGVVEKPYSGNGSSVQLRNFSLRNGLRWFCFNVRNTCSSCLDCSDLFSAHQHGFFSMSFVLPSLLEHADQDNQL
jgi:hypothetical protein